MKVSDIAEDFKDTATTIHTFRRNAKLLLGKAGQAQGIPRELSPSDGFKLWTGSALISAGNFSVAETKKILSQMVPWLKQEGFYIENPAKRKPKLEQEIDGYKLTEIHITVKRVDIDSIPDIQLKYKAIYPGRKKPEEGYVKPPKPGSHTITNNARTICPTYSELKFPVLVNLFKFKFNINI